MYISRVACRRNGATIPVGLSDIYRVSLANNSARNLTGILTYRAGHYLGVLEGSADEVDKTFQQIGADVRNQNVVKLIDTPIANRFFPDWRMKLSEKLSVNSSFVNVMSKHYGRINALPVDVVNLLKMFYDVDAIEVPRPRSFDGKTISLSTWPDFSVVEQTPANIELCAKLVSSQHSYKQVLDIDFAGDRSRLNALLIEFDAEGLLNVAEQHATTVLPVLETAAVRFYAKMKQFIVVGYANEL
ncbi:FAD-dependent sensor of blue light [Arenicella xantha]|uniref:FAD-dependent sensor of blue light n=2 Tax=Arenicella xantha TaxID=644221 RepID=A0A395JNK1_9GAMM|nr:FAD-dependent sensor of blue light [Arenicella xantha]